MNYTPSPHVLQRLASRQAPADEPCTGEPARAAVAQVVEVLAKDGETSSLQTVHGPIRTITPKDPDTLWLQIRRMSVEVVDFYALEAA